MSLVCMVVTAVGSWLLFMPIQTLISISTISAQKILANGNAMFVHFFVRQIAFVTKHTCAFEEKQTRFGRFVIRLKMSILDSTPCSGKRVLSICVVPIHDETPLYIKKHYIFYHFYLLKRMLFALGIKLPFPVTSYWNCSPAWIIEPRP